MALMDLLLLQHGGFQEMAVGKTTIIAHLPTLDFEWEEDFSGVVGEMAHFQYTCHTIP